MSITETHDCFIKVLVDGKEEPCGRPREKLTDLCCLDHWRRVPKKLKQPLIDLHKLRNRPLNSRQLRAHEEKSIRAATAIVEYLKEQKIQLPPAPKLIVEKSSIIRPGVGEMTMGSLVKAESGPKVITNPKLIQP